ncbi:unnamed protein product [Didymodactylos carnosus]|uniref:Transposase Helix-turn-helix domain-containing protein n=1 Tax=Didymodactylos carnosus TaxID=1234261 RepID=A0A814XL28_9BILA|nr:unnamed protein product [Didymodactylos carnosus]CAF1218273.1 unnamed protein product [Didymodactylos carnosus]CAF3783985.1 unnamed protein product [Didymodactylos carnosus]CAF3981782.1 unnamed protein product [Didymodactylos carnosus]
MRIFSLNLSVLMGGFHSLCHLINDFIFELSHAKTTPLLSENDTNLLEDDYISWTRWILEQLKQMTTRVSPRMHSSKHRTPFEAIYLFWVKLKSGLSFRQIGTSFKIDTSEDSIRRRVEDTFHVIRVLEKEEEQNAVDQDISVDLVETSVETDKENVNIGHEQVVAATSTKTAVATTSTPKIVEARKSVPNQRENLAEPRKKTPKGQFLSSIGTEDI